MQRANARRWVLVSFVLAAGISIPAVRAEAAPPSIVTAPSEPRALAALPGASSVSLTWSPPAASNGATVKNYLIEYRAVGAPDWLPFPHVVSSSRSRRVTGLVNGTTYELRVAAVNKAGTGPWSVPALGTAGAPRPPSKPTVDPRDSAVQVSWNGPDANGSAVTDYVIQFRQADVCCTWTVVNDGFSTARSTVVGGLSPDLRYVFQVAAVNARGQGPFSVPSTPISPTLPLRITPIVAEAGYFLVEGDCPPTTSWFSYKWTNAPNGEGNGRITQAKGRFALKLRMMASGPGMTIDATLRCMKGNGRPAKVLGTVPLLSGSDLLPLPENSGTGRRIVYSISAQQLWVVDMVESGVPQPVVTEGDTAVDPAVGDSSTVPTESTVAGESSVPSEPTLSIDPVTGEVQLSSAEPVSTEPVPTATESTDPTSTDSTTPSAEQVVTPSTLTETVVKTHLVSGRRLSLESSRKQLGTFKVFDKRRWGCKGGCPYWLGFHATGDGIIGFHQIPIGKYGPYQQEIELSQPRSHGCVRQSLADAIWLWTWAVKGDVVVVLP